jgi:hypothetical protein
MSRVLTGRVFLRLQRQKNLLQVTDLVDAPLESTFPDVLNDLPGAFADRTLLEVFVREYEGAPDLSSLKLHAGLLDKSLAEVYLILKQHHKPWPGHATLSVSLRGQAPGPAAPVVQNALKLLAAAGVYTTNNPCASSRSCMRAAEQLCRMILVVIATAIRGTTQMPPTAMAVTAWGAAVQSQKKISQRGAVVDGDADGAAAAGFSGNAIESSQPQARSAGARSTHATRRRSQRAAAAAATARMVQDALDPDSWQSVSESDVTQDDADLDARADSGSDAIAETDPSADEVQMHRCTCARRCRCWCGRACCPATRRR